MVPNKNNTYRIIMTLVLLVFCTYASADISMKHYTKEDPLIIEGDWSFPPFEYVDNNGNTVGFNIDLMKALMKKLDIPYIIRLEQFEAVLNKIQSGKADLVCAMYSEKRLKRFKFSPATFTFVYQDIIYRKGHKPIRTFSELKNKRIVVESEAISQNILEQTGHKNFIEINNVEEAIIQLSRGRYDMMMCDHESAVNIIRENNIKNLQTARLDLAPAEYRFASNNDSLLMKVTKAYYELKKSGEYDEIYEKWFKPKQSKIHYFIYPFIIALIILIGILYFIIRNLRRTIYRNNKLLKKNDELLKRALHAGNLQVWRFDNKDGHIYNVDGAVILKDGMRNEDALTLFHEDSREAFIKAMESITKGNEKFAVGIFKLKLPESCRYAKVEFSPIMSEDGKNVDGVLATQRDVTDTVLMQQDLKKEMERAKTSDRLKSAFLANISHEIRTPLNAIVGFSNLLQDTNDPNEIRDFVKIINNNNAILLQLINDILDLSKIESNSVQIEPKNMEFSIAFEDTCNALKQRNLNADVDFIIDNPYFSCIAFIDYKCINQVISNLVDNAIKYTNTGHIRVGYKYVDAKLHIYCEDTGMGISEEKRNRIFERFVKLDDFIHGTGLGLSICKAIVEKMGGTIDFESQINVGTTFNVWIPCKAKINQT